MVFISFSLQCFDFGEGKIIETHLLLLSDLINDKIDYPSQSAKTGESNFISTHQQFLFSFIGHPKIDLKDPFYVSIIFNEKYIFFVCIRQKFCYVILISQHISYSISFFEKFIKVH